MDNIQPILIGLLITVAIGAITIISSYVIKYYKQSIKAINTNIDKIKDEQTKNLVKNAINDLDYLITKYVGSFYETVTKPLKENTNLTKEELTSKLQEVKKQVIELVYEQIPKDAETILNKQINNIEDYISIQIENALKTIKEEQ